MPWPVDQTKLDRVRALMKDQDLTALVVRAPDNVLYLTNYWCMKGYDAVVFPREGDPTLIALEPQLADAQRNSWTRDIRLFKGYDERDPRPPQYRALDLSLEVLKQRGLTDKIAVELNMGTQSADRMVESRPRLRKSFLTHSGKSPARLPIQLPCSPKLVRLKPTRKSSACAWRMNSPHLPWTLRANTCVRA